LTLGFAVTGNIRHFLRFRVKALHIRASGELVKATPKTVFDTEIRKFRQKWTFLAIFRAVFEKALRKRALSLRRLQVSEKIRFSKIGVQRASGLISGDLASKSIFKCDVLCILKENPFKTNG